jgi:hypothetical protein
MFNQLVEQWVKDWKYQKITFLFELVGTLSSITASVLISLYPNTINLLWIFIFWLIGSVSLMISSYLRRIAWPFLLMAVYTMFNIIGLFKTI